MIENKPNGMTRRERKDAQRIIQMMMNSPIKDAPITDVDGERSIESLKGKNLDVMTRIILAQANEAVKGDRQSAEFLFKYGGFEPPKEQTISMETVTIVNDMDIFGEDEGEKPEKKEVKPKEPVDPRTGLIASAVLYDDPDESTND